MQKTYEPARTGDVLLIFGPGYWAKGESWVEVTREYRAAGGSLKEPFNVWSVHPSTYVNEYGGTVRDAGTPAPLALHRGDEWLGGDKP